MTNDLPKPDDQNGWNERMEAMFGDVFGTRQGRIATKTMNEDRELLRALATETEA